MPLPDQNLVIQTVPASGPVFVGPAETKWDGQLGVGEQLVHWAFEQPLPAEPIVVKAEPVDAELPRQIDLLPHDVFELEIIEAESPREPRLIVPVKRGLSADHVPPIG